MSTPVQPLHLLLLAQEAQWPKILRECLVPLGSTVTLVCAPNWEDVSGLFDDELNAVLLTPPQLQPAPGRCKLPVVMLFEHEPTEPPIDVSDWLVLEALNADTVRRCLRHVRERSVLENTLQRLAEQDPLTGIANRQGFQTLLTARLAENDGRGLALGHLDLDNFRHANDALGHQAGDRLILQVVSRLKSQLEAGDQLARLGSDEFALLIDTRRAPQRAEWMAERITDAMSEAYWVDGESLLIGCSLGIAHARAQAGADPLMWHAHIAMQQAKSTQGCTFHIFNERINRNARSLADLETELRRALRRDELELHYQPRLSLEEGRIVGLEALVRWRHAERGLLAPSEFVPLAEQSGLIVPLGYWVISRALRDMQDLRERGLPPLHMAVNLSFRQFQDSQLLSTLSRLIAERGVDARWLEFELTETAVMRRSDLVKQTMDALGRLGVRFSLDDFGTGFSSFVHLNSLPIALLKVDKSFVGGMELREENRKLVHAMINLAHNLNLEVVAEGVETAEQLELLRGFGCDQVQGYLISKPLPLDSLVEYLTFGQREDVGHAKHLSNN
ncbi:bifunctional diguanylate cyclase/phosphodiesterase [Pseudomonas sp. 10B1]|uniref:putative bifunctional diguanylate cyclase/phosphodiesterase n=1 Tax=unclassified Pseudomonas TaxID=196821 RepID=UPI002AB4D0CB|nr:MULTISPECIES: bifunctional diguanylate cyclase/phosphodiesterase [unclassified Pseudomonas]MDY7562730.1 bifunctional diguanylate cyclase/phosphodiesterase [Pseudomonas sp. AB6]MEA9996922.1 bifunctional diguanylate cyclase/phosphodiesterase [Pseudomonas sp. AA4]MEB0089157.1 bifunctional diguanylate cyclase/phosphodiesterase [Pseudomonas sp. RTI1]MEB0128349.1 bifunctional diguanylate cyclase/phosphodiesterase [Pseudomonas sp. CCC1.2]MEB0154306.1 bifunctional diguanylate cyclase/phosphodiester